MGIWRVEAKPPTMIFHLIVMAATVISDHSREDPVYYSTTIEPHSSIAKAAWGSTLVLAHELEFHYEATEVLPAVGVSMPESAAQPSLIAGSEEEQVGPLDTPLASPEHQPPLAYAIAIGKCLIVCCCCCCLLLCPLVGCCWFAVVC